MSWRCWTDGIHSVAHLRLALGVQVRLDLPLKILPLLLMLLMWLLFRGP